MQQMFYTEEITYQLPKTKGISNCNGNSTGGQGKRKQSHLPQPVEGL